MGNPLILIIIWFVFNLFVKSAKDKRKIEEARRKRSQQLGKSRPNTFSQELRKTVSTFREEIEREVQREKQKKVGAAPKKDTIYRSNMECGQLQPREELNWDIHTPSKPKETNTAIKEKSNEVSKPSINIKNDVIRGLIFSEILSEPKSIQNIKRSI